MLTAPYVRHGYVSNLPRPWLALVLVLNSALLQGACNSIERSTANIIDLRSVPQLKGVFDFKVDIQENSRAVQAFLPQSHHGLWHLAVKWYTERVRPVSTAALLCTLLEHGLRLEWCRYNHRPSDRIARPGVFYVTLDGHGQRHVHDLLLHPYMMNDSGRNLLVENLPGSTTAILTDMFCSSCGGPNIRSTISHGVWDSFLADEWNQTKKPDEQTLLLWDTAEAVMVSMMWSSLKKPMPYCPVFSYAATTRRNLLQAQRSIQVLEQAQSSEDYIHFLAMATNMFGEVPEDIASLQSNGSCHSSFFHGEQSQTLWRSVDVFDEHELNKSFGNAGAARCLLQDIASATNDHVAYLHEALTYLASPQGKASKRAHRRSLRIVYSSQVAVIFYTFAVRVAMICLRQEMGDEVMVKRSTLLKAVERSRMVVSTVKRFLHSNADRAIKSIKEYTKGRAIKDVISLGNKLT